MKKNNTADFTQFELFDESMNIFEIVQTAEKEKTGICPVCGEITNYPFLPLCSDCELDKESDSGSFNSGIIANIMKRSF